MSDLLQAAVRSGSLAVLERVSVQPLIELADLPRQRKAMICEGARTFLAIPTPRALLNALLRIVPSTPPMA